MRGIHFRSLAKAFVAVYALSLLVLPAMLVAPRASAATCSGLQLGSFNKYVSYIIAQREGFFAQEGVTVCYNQVASSTQQFNSLASGQYDIIGTSLDNVANRVVNAGGQLSLIAGTEQGAGLVLAVNTANGINSIADLRGKPIAVDAPDSGLVFSLRKILSANGLNYPQDYSFQVVGGVALRFQYLQAGQLPNGEKVYAAMFNAPTTARLTAPVQIIAKFSDYLAPFQSGSYATSYPFANSHGATLEAFLRASIRGERFAQDSNNRAKAIADIAAELKLDSATAEAVLGYALDPVSGENIDLRMNKQGLIANVQLRQDYNGFNTPLSHSDIEHFVNPGVNKFYDDRFWKAAEQDVHNAYGEAYSGTGDGQDHHDGDDTTTDPKDVGDD